MGEYLAVYPLREAFVRAGAKRVSEEALKELSDILEAIAIQVVEDAKEYANASRRKTVMKKDIEKACEPFSRVIHL